MTHDELQALLATIERGWEVSIEDSSSLLWREEGKGTYADKDILAGRQATTALVQHVERLTKALEFYADGDSYYIDKYFGGCAVGRDKGGYACEALSAGGQPDTGKL